MLVASFLVFALASTGFAQVPAGYRTVYITSLVDTTFVIVPTSPKNGSTVVVFVPQPRRTIVVTFSNLLYLLDRNGITSQSNNGISKMATPQSNWQTLRFAWMLALKVSVP